MEPIETDLHLVCGGNRTPANEPNGNPAEYQRAYDNRQQEYQRILPEPTKEPQQFAPTPANWG